MWFVPASLRLGTYTSQSPIQKSNWRDWVSEHGLGCGGVWAAAVRAKPIIVTLSAMARPFIAIPPKRRPSCRARDSSKVAGCYGENNTHDRDRRAHRHRLQLYLPIR